MASVLSLDQVLDATKRAQEIALQEEDEAQPYKHKYAAADLLASVLGEGPGNATSATAAPAAQLESLVVSDDIRTSSTKANEVATATATQRPLDANSPDSSPAPPSSPLALALAAARLRHGLILLESDLIPDGEAAVNAALPTLEAACSPTSRSSPSPSSQRPSAFLAWLLEAYNALGALYSGRGESSRALDVLQRAEALYGCCTGSRARSAHLPIAGAEPTRAQTSGGAAAEPSTGSVGGETAASQPECSGAAAAEAAAAAVADPAAAGLTETPAAGPARGLTAAAEAATAGLGAGDDVAVAREAAAAVGPESGAAAAAAAAAAAGDVASRLPGCSDAAVQAQYTSTLFYLAQVHGALRNPGRSALYCGATMYRQLAAGKYDLDTWVNNCLQLGGYYARAHAYGMALYCHAAAEAVVARDTAAGCELGEDVAANIQLAYGRLHGLRLAASHTRFVEGRELEQAYPDVSHFPDYLRFPGLAMPAPDTFPWGEAALARDFEAARDLFNAAMPRFKAALAYYQLDGWVTDHVTALMDMSNLYRCLAGFEPDSGRAAAMHRCRAQLLEPLSGALNPTHYPGLSRSIDLELGNTWRAVSDIRQAAGQAAKASAAAASATRYYARFLRALAPPDAAAAPSPAASSDAAAAHSLPAPPAARLDADSEPHWLAASFGMGRVAQRMREGGPGDDGTHGALVLAAQRQLAAAGAYVRVHGVEGWREEAKAAEELASLLEERRRLRAIAAAKGLANK